jgi:hypothetical protein
MALLRPRRGTAAALASVVLRDGEIAFVKDDETVVMGDGTTAVGDLPDSRRFVNAGQVPTLDDVEDDELPVREDGAWEGVARSSLALTVEGEWNDSTAYSSSTLVTHDDQAWISSEDTDAGDEPGVSAKWTALPAAVDALHRALHLPDPNPHGIMGGLPLEPSPLSDVQTFAEGSNPRPKDFFDGFLWGNDGATVYRSNDSGTTWDEFATGPDSLIRLLPCDDGEVLWVASDKVYKSDGWGDTPTWDEKLEVTGPDARILAWGADGDGTKFIIGEYASPFDNWDESRFAWIRTDGGDTFTAKYDAVDRYLRLELVAMGNAEESQREHRAILAACARGDVEGAIGLYAKHIAEAGEDLARALEARKAVAT